MTGFELGADLAECWRIWITGMQPLCYELRSFLLMGREVLQHQCPYVKVTAGQEVFSSHSAILQ